MYNTCKLGFQSGKYCFFLSKNSIVFLYLKGKEAKTQRDNLPNGSLPKCQLEMGLSLAEVRNKTLNPSLLHGFPGFKHVSRHLLLPDCALASSWSQKHSWDLNSQKCGKQVVSLS